MSLRRAAAHLALLGVLVAPTPATSAAQPVLEVAVSIGPLVELVERLGGDSVHVTLLTPLATPPESWAPTPREALALARADLYVSIGHPGLAAERPHLEALARGLDRLERLSLMESGAGPDSIPSGDAGDPHLWMDLDLLATLASSVAAWLVTHRPEAAQQVERGLIEYLEDLRSVDSTLAELLGPPHRRPAVFQHPAWQRLLDRYAVAVLSVESEGKEPSPARLAALIEQARRLGVQTIFSQTGASDRGARLLAAEIGAEVVALDPTSQSWLETLVVVGEQVSRAIR